MNRVNLLYSVLMSIAIAYCIIGINHVANKAEVKTTTHKNYKGIKCFHCGEYLHYIDNHSKECKANNVK